MSYKAQYVTLPEDKTAHIIGDGQRTVCGEALPYASAWDTEEPDKVCSKCAKRAKAESEPADEPLVDEPVEEAPKANKTTTDDAPAKATKSSGKA